MQQRADRRARAPMRPALCLLALALGACQVPSGAPRGEGVVHFYLGGRSQHDDGFWASLEDQFAAGLDVTTRKADSPIGWTFGTTFAGARGSATTNGPDPVTLSIELYLGPRLSVPLGRTPLLVYGGLGPSLAYTVVDRDPGQGVGSVRADDWGLGAYGQLGVLCEVAADMAVGLEYRTLQFAAMDFFGQEADLDYQQIALVLAFGF